MDVSDHMQEPALAHVRRDFIALREDLSVAQALDALRQDQPTGPIAYLYATDADGRLTGVVPTRRLLTGSPDARLSEIMVRRVIALPASATLLDACELFVLHKLLAFPVLDAEGRMLGLVDVNVFTSEVLDLAERQHADELFETIGLRIAQVRETSPLRAFRFRFPWLLATVASGTACALLASRFELTLAKSIVLTFFVTLVLGLGESVSVQSMTLVIQRLRASSQAVRRLLPDIARETATALLLGAGCGVIVALLAGLWLGFSMATVVIGASIVLAVLSASVIGFTVPTVIHWLRLDPKIAAGPVTLAAADVATLAIYLALASWWL